MDDPDVPAKTVVHWLIYDIPAGTRSLPEGVPTKKKLADGSSQGQNIRKKVGYTGPCPEKGGPAHHYFFKLYALDAKTRLKPDAKKEELEAAMKGHILAQAAGDWEVQALEAKSAGLKAATTRATGGAGLRACGLRCTSVSPHLMPGASDAAPLRNRI